MFQLLNLTRRVLPYLITGLALLFLLTGIATLFTTVPAAPALMTMAELRDTPLKQLPPWVEVRDAHVFWPGAAVVVSKNQRTGEKVGNNAVVVPLFDSESLARWGSNSPLPSAASGYLMKLPWDAVRRDHPRVALKLEQGRGGDLIKESAASRTVSFEPADAAVQFAFGPEKSVIQEMHTLGFRDVVGVIPGSKPLLKGQAAAAVIFGLFLLTAGVLWIRRRRRSAEAESFADHQARAAARGASAGASQSIRNAVSEGVRRALQQVREERSAPKP